MIRKIIIITALCFVYIIAGNAQQLPIQSQNMFNKYNLSPAYAGFNGNTEAYIGYRQSWMGMKGAPTQTLVNVNGRMLEKMGYGVNVIAASTGNFREILIDLSYAYHVDISQDMGISFGISPKLYRNQIDISNVDSYGSQIDPFLQNNDALTGTSFDAGFGVLFNVMNFNIGLHAPRLIGLQMKYQDTDQAYTLQRHFMGHLSYSLTVADKYTIEPMAVVRMTLQSTINYEGSILVKYKQRMWTGFSYRAGNFVSASFGGALSDRMVMSYHYEFGFGGLSNASSGSHEFSMGFLISRAKNRKEPCIFPDAQEQGGSDNNKDDIKLQRLITKLEQQLKKETENRESEIKRLEKMIEDIGKQAELQSDINEALKWQDPFVLKNIMFGNGSNRLFSSSYPELNKLVKEMTQNSERRIRIVGYTDNMGSPAYNKKLSERRAQAVADYLTRNGIQKDRIETEGKGESDPIATNSTPEGRAANRRIQVQWSK